MYFRSGLYPLPLPAELGMEGAGEVTALGDGVTEFALDDRAVLAALRAPGCGAGASRSRGPLDDGIDDTVAIGADSAGAGA